MWKNRLVSQRAVNEFPWTSPIIRERSVKSAWNQGLVSALYRGLNKSPDQ